MLSVSSSSRHFSSSPLQPPLSLITKLTLLLFREIFSCKFPLKAKIKTNRWHRINFYIHVQAKNAGLCNPYESVKTSESVTQSHGTIIGMKITLGYWDFRLKASRLGFSSWSRV